MGRTCEIANHTFPIISVLFFLYHFHPMLYFINYPHQLSITRGNVTNPSYGENLENWQSYIFHSIDAFFLSDFHLMVYFITREMYGFPHQFSIALGNAAKPIKWGKSGKLVPTLFPQYGCFFSLDFHPVGYFIIWEMHGFPHQFPKAQEN